MFSGQDYVAFVTLRVEPLTFSTALSHRVMECFQRLGFLWDSCSLVREKTFCLWAFWSNGQDQGSVCGDGKCVFCYDEREIICKINGFKVNGVVKQETRGLWFQRNRSSRKSFSF